MKPENLDQANTMCNELSYIRSRIVYLESFLNAAKNREQPFTDTISLNYIEFKCEDVEYIAFVETLSQYFKDKESRILKQIENL